jgi:hypothetical protein
LLLEEVPLEGAEELFGLGQGQPEMLDALMVLVEDEDIGDSLFLTLIVTQDELQFDTHTGASPGLSDRGRAQAILPEFCSYPQHLPALSTSYPSTVLGSTSKTRAVARIPKPFGQKTLMRHFHRAYGPPITRSFSCITP